MVGLFVVLSGLVSSAALSNGFVGYLQTMVSVPDWIASPIVVLALGALAAWGIAESVIVAAVVTVVEVGALVVLLGIGFDHLAAAPANIADFVPPLEAVPLVVVLSGGVLACITSLVVLTIFAAINLALLAVKRRDPRPEGVTVYPAILPVCGFLASLGIILFEVFRIAGI